MIKELIKKVLVIVFLTITTVMFCCKGWGYNVFNDKYLNNQTAQTRKYIYNSENGLGTVVSKHEYVDNFVHNIAEDYSIYIIEIDQGFENIYVKVSEKEYKTINIGSEYKISDQKIYSSLQDVEKIYNQIYSSLISLEVFYNIFQQIYKSYV